MPSEYDDFVASPIQSLVTDERQRAISTASASANSIQVTELRWAQANPAGRVTQESESSILLWNFDVAKADLKPEHTSALVALSNPGLLLADRSQLTFVITGYASATGAPNENSRIAQARAAYAGAWLDARGFTTVLTNAWPGVVPGADGSDPVLLAHGRAARVERLDPPPARTSNTPDDPISAPEFVYEASLKPDGTTVPMQFATGPDEASVAIPLEDIQIFKFPPPPQLVGAIILSGTVRCVFGDAASQGKFRAEARVGYGAWGVELKAKINDSVKAVLRLTEPKDGKSGVIGIGAQFGNFTFRFQSKAAFARLEWSLPSISLPPIHLDSVGVDVTCSLEPKLGGEIGPGPALLGEFGIGAWEVGADGALTDAAVASLGSVGLAALSAAVVLALVVTIPARADSEAFGYAVLLAQRNGFAARIAVAITGANQSQSDAYLSSWGATPNDDTGLAVRKAIYAGFTLADQQLSALSAADLATRVRGLTAKYGTDSSGNPDLQFNHVANRVLDALGGTDSTGGPPSLGAL
jgi:hypothetical protein